ncbi:MAG: nucleoside 2-deoxyribosyltransferase [Xanthobacteraceae bacterium]|nr:nucleoside 2-deoxyribosyltransferase [Xanthobacteraceae bacterium]
MKIYLAGPDVFLPNAVAMGRRKRDLCERYGHEGLYPLDNEVDPRAKDASLRIFQGNQDMMDIADAIIANLTPFRGPSADAGTIFELGYMAGWRTPEGLRKICLGYSNAPAPYATRVANFTDLKKTSEGQLLDPDDMIVEDFGHADNLMIVHALEERGHPLMTASEIKDWDDLSLFEECLKLLDKRKGPNHA